MNIQINKSISLFLELLKSSWNVVLMIGAEDRSTFFVQNWLQANWEMVVEGLANQDGRKPIVCIDYYGEGSEDLHHTLIKGQSGYDRVSLPSLAPTHAVVARTKGGSRVKCIFSGELVNIVEGSFVVDRFGTMKNGKAVEDLPFDTVTLKSGMNYVVARVQELDFF